MIEAKALFKRHLLDFEKYLMTGTSQETKAILYAACIVAETISRSMNDEMFDQKVYEKQGGQK